MEIPPGGMREQLEAEAVDAPGGVGHHHRGGALVGGEAGEGAEAPCPAVVPDHAWPSRLLDQEPAKPDLYPASYPCVRLLRESERSAEWTVGRPQARCEEAKHVLDAGAQAARGGHEVLDRWARMPAT